MGRIVELNHEGDTSIIWDAAGTAITAAAAAFAGYMARGYLLFEVGARHAPETDSCEKCSGNGSVVHEPGQVVHQFSPEACTIVATPRIVGG